LAHATPQTTTFAVAVQRSAVPFAITDSTTTVTDAPCHRKGTRILMERGGVTIETLAIGDLVVTGTGRRRPIKWIGRREVDCQAHHDAERVWPVRIAAGAVAPGVPHRDLYVSPDHCISFDDVLVVARLILNGSTIGRLRQKN
jgi:hypothetical protein